MEAVPGNSHSGSSQTADSRSTVVEAAGWRAADDLLNAKLLERRLIHYLATDLFNLRKF